MGLARITTALAALLLGAHLAAAQQPSAPTQPEHGPPPAGMGMGMGGGTGMGMSMHMMDSMDARLDSMVGRMNQATGNRKMSAMAAVITEMVAQRRVMQEHMRTMMESHHKAMMDRMGASGTAGAPAPAADSAPADTAGHEGHHPQC